MVKISCFPQTWLLWMPLAVFIFCLHACGDPKYDGMLAAVKDDDARQVRACLDEGMDVNHLYKHRNTLLHFVRSEEMATMLIGYEANVDAKNHRGNTPLHAAALNGFIGPIRSLISHGAAVNITNDKGQTPLFMVVTLPYDEDDFRELFTTQAGHWEAKPEIAILLMEHGADARHQDATGRNIFQVAEARGHPNPEPVQAVSSYLSKSLKP